MKKHIIIVLIMIIAILLTACGPSETWEEHYDLGMKYLSEGNYEEAIVEFTTAIEIDPNQGIVYLGRGDAYFHIGGEDGYLKAKSDYEKCLQIDGEIGNQGCMNLAKIYIYFDGVEEAESILRNLYDNEDELQDYLEGETTACFFEKNAQNIVDVDDFLFLERPWLEYTTQAYAKEAFLEVLSDQYDILTPNDEICQWVEARTKGDHMDVPIFWCNQNNVSLAMSAARMNNDSELLYEKRNLGFNDIYTMDSAESVLSKLGIKNAEKVWEKIKKCRSKEIYIREIWLNGMKVDINTSTTNNGNTSAVPLQFSKEDKFVQFEFVNGKLDNVFLSQGEDIW